MSPANDLVASVHAALNRTAVARTPDPALLPPRAEPTSRLLPAPLEPRGILGDVLVQRRSRYRFGSRQPGLAELASLLRLGVATAPRAGGLVSVVPYLVVRGHGNLPLGVHRADLRLPLPSLVAVREGDPTAYLAGSVDQPEFASRVPVWVAFAVPPDVLRGRYPARHYRTVHLDAGAALQSTLLVATALGLSVCPVMGYDDAAWERLLDLPDGGLVAGIVAVG